MFLKYIWDGDDLKNGNLYNGMYHLYATDNLNEAVHN